MSNPIGLITFHETTNFGSLLQTYALYKKMVDIGCNCEIVDYQCENIIEKEIPKPLKFRWNLRLFFHDLIYGNIVRQKHKQQLCFIKEHAKLGNRYDRSNIIEACDKYSKFLVGSDIVWGTDITKGDLTYFLDFEKDKRKKYAFASSVGTPWNEKEKELIKPLLEDFSQIAVREEESANWVEELTNNRPSVVCDPTMLLTTKEWMTFVEKKKAEKYILVYFETETIDCKKTAYYLAKKYGYIVRYITYGRSHAKFKAEKPTKVQEFLSLIYNAEMVITASYHGMLFSLYFNKPLIYFERAHASRMQTLANKLDINERNGKQMNLDCIPPMDYNIINQKMDLFRNESINKLKEFLL